MLFLKNRKSDGFLLLYSEEKQNYYLWLNLHPKDSRFARRVAVDGLVDVRTGEMMSFSSATGALFPVAFGRDFQLERFIREARPQSAKLLESDGRFEVHITFEYEAPAVTADTTLGVDRGIYNLASMSVIDETGAVMDSENLDGRALRHVQRIHERRQRDTQRRGRRYSGRSRRAMADEAVHVTANRIVEVARHNRSQVVLENLRQLTSTGRKRARSNFNRLLNRSQYQKLQRVFEYKLAVVGLPSPKTVSAAYTSQTCPRCGFQARENRLKVPDGDGFKMDRFECLRCGHQADADINAARVIALKRAWRESLPASQRPKTMAEMPPKHAFELFLRNRAEMRGNGPCDLRVGTSGGHELREAGPNPPEQSGGNLTPARTPRRTEKSAAKPPRLSSSSGNPPPLRGDRHGKSDA